jgi:hypothetical protein
MRLLHIHRALLRCLAGFGLLASLAFAQGQSNFAKQIKSSACPNDDSALKLPPGFCATVFADGIGHARHLVVSAGGLVYVNTWSSPGRCCWRFLGYNSVPECLGSRTLSQWKQRHSRRRERIGTLVGIPGEHVTPAEQGVHAERIINGRNSSRLGRIVSGWSTRAAWLLRRRNGNTIPTMATNGDCAVRRDQTSDFQLLINLTPILVDRARPDGYLRFFQSNMARLRRAVARGFGGLEVDGIYPSRGCRGNRGIVARVSSQRRTLPV